MERGEFVVGEIQTGVQVAEKECYDAVGLLNERLQEGTVGS